MFTKQSCQNCGTHIEFNGDLIGNEVFTVSCPKCQAPVILLRPPPISAPPLNNTRKRHRLWILGIGITAFVMLILLLTSVLNLPPAYAITPEPYYRQKPLSRPIDKYAFDLAVKELNKLFYKSGDFIFVNVFRESSEHPTFRLEPINRYVQGKRVVYTFGCTGLSEADVMNGWEYMAQVKFFIVGAKRKYNPSEDRGWSAWTMFPGDTETDNFLYGTTLWFNINKKKGGNWELTQPPPNLHPTIRPMSRDKVDELLKLP